MEFIEKDKVSEHQPQMLTHVYQTLFDNCFTQIYKQDEENQDKFDDKMKNCLTTSYNIFKQVQETFDNKFEIPIIYYKTPEEEQFNQIINELYLEILKNENINDIYGHPLLINNSQGQLLERLKIQAEQFKINTQNQDFILDYPNQNVYKYVKQQTDELQLQQPQKMQDYQFLFNDQQLNNVRLFNNQEIDHYDLEEEYNTTQNQIQNIYKSQNYSVKDSFDSFNESQITIQDDSFLDYIYDYSKKKNHDNQLSFLSNNNNSITRTRLDQSQIRYQQNLKQLQSGILNRFKRYSGSNIMKYVLKQIIKYYNSINDFNKDFTYNLINSSCQSMEQDQLIIIQKADVRDNFNNLTNRMQGIYGYLNNFVMTKEFKDQYTVFQNNDNFPIYAFSYFCLACGLKQELLEFLVQYDGNMDILISLIQNNGQVQEKFIHPIGDGIFRHLLSVIFGQIELDEFPFQQLRQYIWFKMVANLYQNNNYQLLAEFQAEFRKNIFEGKEEYDFDSKVKIFTQALMFEELIEELKMNSTLKIQSNILFYILVEIKFISEKIFIESFQSKIVTDYLDMIETCYEDNRIKAMSYFCCIQNFEIKKRLIIQNLIKGNLIGKLFNLHEKNNLKIFQKIFDSDFYQGILVELMNHLQKKEKISVELLRIYQEKKEVQQLVNLMINRYYNLVKQLKIQTLEKRNDLIELDKAIDLIYFSFKKLKGINLDEVNILYGIKNLLFKLHNQIISNDEFLVQASDLNFYNSSYDLEDNIKKSILILSLWHLKIIDKQCFKEQRFLRSNFDRKQAIQIEKIKEFKSNYLFKTQEDIKLKGEIEIEPMYFHKADQLILILNIMNPLKTKIGNNKNQQIYFKKKNNLQIFEEQADSQRFSQHQESQNRSTILGNISQILENPKLQNSLINNQELIESIKQKLIVDLKQEMRKDNIKLIQKTTNKIVKKELGNFKVQLSKFLNEFLKNRQYDNPNQEKNTENKINKNEYQEIKETINELKYNNREIVEFQNKIMMQMQDEIDNQKMIIQKLENQLFQKMQKIESQVETQQQELHQSQENIKKEIDSYLNMDQLDFSMINSKNNREESEMFDVQKLSKDLTVSLHQNKNVIGSKQKQKPDNFMQTQPIPKISEKQPEDSKQKKQKVTKQNLMESGLDLNTSDNTIEYCIDDQGYLVDDSGFPILDDQGKAIRLDDKQIQHLKQTDQYQEQFNIFIQILIISYQFLNIGLLILNCAHHTN